LRLRKAWLGLALVAVIGLSAVAAALEALATNAATQTTSKWPLGLNQIQKYPFQWLVGSSGFVALFAVTLWWLQRRLENGRAGATSAPDLAGATGKLRRVRDARRREFFGIHPAIPLPAKTEASLDPELPAYVERDIDNSLHSTLRSMRRSGGFVLLVGDSAVGKSRCAFEAAQAVLGDWRLFIPPNASALISAITTGLIRKKTLIWLDEIQEYLQEPNGLTVSSVTNLLGRRTSIIIMSTIWPGRLDVLVTAGALNEYEPVMNQSRRVIAMASRFALPAFSASEYSRAQELSKSDPRLAEALRHHDKSALTQALACRTELLERWRLGTDHAGKAVISAAVDARRCGHPEIITLAVLAALAPTYLAAADRPALTGDWIDQALRWACAPVRPRTNMAPLTPVGDEPGHIDGYRVNDMLVDEASRNPSERLPNKLWQKLVDTSSHQACISIGLAAYHESQHQIARRAFSRAASDGDTQALIYLGALLWEAGERDAAKRWLQRAVKAGKTDAMVVISWYEYRAGKHTEAKQWLQRAADAGNAEAMGMLATMNRDAGQSAEAELWCRLAIQAGNIETMNTLGALKAEIGKSEEAMSWFQQAADHGSPNGMANLGQFLRDRGKTQQAEIWLQRAFDAGQLNIANSLGVLLAQREDFKGAELVFTKAVENGNTEAMANLGIMLEKQGRRSEAESWLRRAIAAGHKEALFNLGLLFDNQGNIGEAESWYRKALAKGDDQSTVNLAHILRRRGEFAEAETLYRRAAEQGNHIAMNNLGVILKNRGELAEAEILFRRAAAKDGGIAMVNLGKLLTARGQVRAGVQLIWNGSLDRARKIRR
jgi:TPR repeat protein